MTNTDSHLEVNTEKFGDVWQQEEHAQIFDGWAKLSDRKLKSTYENFSEIKLLLRYKRQIKGKTFMEIGCATGELYRYLRKYHSEYQYTGYDISIPAITRAREKYPKANFSICDEGLSNLPENEKPSILFSRDVVLHQPNPFAFLLKLLSIPSEVAILRLRTKDMGITELDPTKSCQYYCGHWVPYMILGMTELTELLKQHVNYSRLVFTKDYKILGGNERRYLPKDCYLSETRTAETAMYVELTR